MKILIIKTSSLGDIIHAFPILNYIRHFHPEATIEWAVDKRFKDLIEAHPLVDRVISLDIQAMKQGFKALKKAFLEARRELRQVSYDVVFDLQGNIKSGCILSQVKSLSKVGFGKKTVPEWPNLAFTNIRFNPPEGLNIRQDYLFLVESFFGNPCPSEVWQEPIELMISPEEKTILRDILSHKFFCGKKVVLVCPGSAWKNKQCTFDALKEMLLLMRQSMNVSFAFVWGQLNEKEEAIQLVEALEGDALLLDKLRLPVLQNLMGEVDLVIAMDSLALHLAGTTKTSTYGFFGPSSATKYNPLGPQHFFFQGKCPYGQTFLKRCPILRSCATGACLREASGQFLLNYLQSNKK